ncbi:MAG: hypothetical protein JNJ70_16810 [Verrucomicrobiales bacterium]|nr:hypothetical protein [Verrucomicrobiales bacterium]
MIRLLVSASLVLAGVASGTSVFAQGAPVPPVPAPAPMPGLTSDPFDRVVLSPVPAPGESVPGWYPLERMVWDGMQEVREDRSPDIFAADQGVLRFLKEFDGYPSGRVRQLPDGTSQVCVDLYFYEGAAEYAGYGMAGGFDEYGYPLYGVTIWSGFGPRDSEPQEGVEEGDLNLTYVISGPGFYEEIEEDLSGQWLRLCMKLDATRTVYTVELNGEVVYSGPLKGRRSGTGKDIEEPSELLPFFTDVALVGGFGGVASEPEASSMVEESRIPLEAFFDNFSHNGAGNEVDLTVGPSRTAVGRVGAGVFGRDASAQSINLNALFDQSPTAYFLVQNPGSGASAVNLRGNGGGRKMKVKSVLSQGGKTSNVTSGLRAGTVEVTLNGNGNAMITSEASLKGNVRTAMSRLRGRFVNGSQAVIASSGGSVVDAASANFSFESAIPVNRRER